MKSQQNDGARIRDMSSLRDTFPWSMERQIATRAADWTRRSSRTISPIDEDDNVVIPGNFQSAGKELVVPARNTRYNPPRHVLFATISRLIRFSRICRELDAALAMSCDHLNDESTRAIVDDNR